MVLKITLSKNNPYIGVLAAAALVSDTVPVEITWSCNENLIEFADKKRFNCQSQNDILRTLARLAPAYNLYGKTAIESVQVDHWLTYALSLEEFMENSLEYLNKTIASVTFLCTHSITIADLAVYNELCWYYDALLAKGLLSEHVKRWYQLIHNQPAVQDAWQKLPKDAKRKNVVEKAQVNEEKSERKQEGKFIDLPGAEMGKVVVRFPPEASGYLHIGHAKAALLNQYYALAFEGKLIMRFDDTNPAKETVEFEEVILEDLELLKIKPDIFTHTSNYFDLMLSYCEQLINEGKAYVDDTPPEQMKLEREQRVESKNRSNSKEQNMKMWKEMLVGSEFGQRCCVRAKIDMSSPNGCLRDPTIYRCKNEPHPRTGTKYKVYPTYDFACPIVDAIENVTHTLRTMEYHDRDDQFYWFIDALKLRKPYIWEYSRLNMTNTVLSKRKLTWFVEQGLVDGWDDPRFPTVRGIIRRGMTVEGLKEFIIAQGSSKSVVFMNWDKIWAFNKKVIDPIAPRYTTLEIENRVIVNVEGAKYEQKEVPLHPKNESVGKKLITLAPRVYIDYEDAIALKEGENATFINWGNLLIKKIVKSSDGRISSIEAALNLENTDFKKTTKLTWLAVEEQESAYPPCFCVYFDNIISKSVLGKDEDFKNFIGHKTREEIQMLAEPELKKLKKGDIIQLQRRGFFKVDNAYAPASPFSNVVSPLILFSIPDGHTKNMPSSGLKINANSAKDTTEVSKSSALTHDDLNNRIIKQGELVRELKAKKSEKGEIDAQVKILLELKAQYKTLTGSVWSPTLATAASNDKPATSKNSNDLSAQITQQGDKVRQLKTEKAEKSAIDAAVKALLDLKAQYKSATGQDWKPTASTTPVNKNTDDLSAQITQQGDKVRQLKTEKAEKSAIDAAVKALLDLKAQYKSATGQDWKPTASTTTVNKNTDDLSAQITQQGDKVRQLKTEKAEKSTIDAAVKVLLDLKAQYKSATGQDWKPTASTTTVNKNTDDLSAQITQQGDKVRQLKTEKAEKSTIDAAVKVLLELKAEFQKLTGKAWTAAPLPAKQEPNPDPPSPGIAVNILQKISQQGDKIRELKANKADKATVEAEVKLLLALKSDYKSLTGQDWKPGAVAPKPSATSTTIDLTQDTEDSSSGTTEKDLLTKEIQAQAEKVKSLKASNKPKEEIDMEVTKLLALKAKYKEVTGSDFPTAGRSSSKRSKESSSSAPKKEPTKSAPKTQEVKVVNPSGVKKQTRLGLEAKKEENLPDWYSQVITKGELIEYYDVSGCYILRPWSFAIWRAIRQWFDNEITKMGVKECYFPMFVSRQALEREKTHIADFAPEVAWVTKSGETDLAEPIAVRPTSETVMYPTFAKWVQSYRDLPIRVNQWSNVVRWEFKHPQPFLRTREFLWQEGHTAWANKDDADEEVLQILDLYAKVYTDLLAIPVVRGRKTKKEEFAGADYTTTVEAFISASGRAIQGATSHHLGQNFSKMFEIVYEDPETNQKKFVYQNSWGITTRTIGVMVMVHSDDQGLVLPPHVAAIQVIIVPCGITVNTKDTERNELMNACKKLEKQLLDKGIQCEGDYRDNYSPGWKFNHWELKGVPVRIEVGPKDLKANQIVAVRRDTGEKLILALDNVDSKIQQLLETIHDSMFSKAQKELAAHTKLCKNWKDFCALLDQKNLLLAPFCDDKECEGKIKEDSARDESEDAGAPTMGAKGLCIPFDQPAAITSNDKCIHPSCTNAPKYYTLFGRSY